MVEMITAPVAKSPDLRWHVLACSRLWAHDGRRPCLQRVSSLAGEVHHRHQQDDSRMRQVTHFLSTG